MYKSSIIPVSQIPISSNKFMAYINMADRMGKSDRQNIETQQQ